MADSVNRIVPPSVSLDRTPALGRERKQKNNKDQQKRGSEKGAEPPVPESSGTPEYELTELEKNKGKHLDIKA